MNINNPSILAAKKGDYIFGTSEVLDCDVADAIVGVRVMADAIHFEQ